MEKLWTTAEVAEFLGIDDVDVDGLVREGVLTGYKLGGQFLRFRPDQVKALKGTIRFRRAGGRARLRPAEAWPQQVREFVYHYDFYIASIALLAVLLVYLIAT